VTLGEGNELHDGGDVAVHAEYRVSDDQFAARP